MYHLRTPTYSPRRLSVHCPSILVQVKGHILEHNAEDSLQAYRVQCVDGQKHWFSAEVIQKSRSAPDMRNMDLCDPTIGQTNITDQRHQHDMKLKDLLGKQSGVVQESWSHSLADIDSTSNDDVFASCSPEDARTFGDVLTCHFRSLDSAATRDVLQFGNQLFSTR